MDPAPVALFAYRRPDHLARVVVGLQANRGAADTSLYVFCDGAKGTADSADVAAVRTVAHAITGFASMTVIERAENFGLARSIRDGVDQLCQRYGRAIVLEDDVVPTPHFLAYVNAALERYACDERVISVGCYTFSDGNGLPETFFLNIPDCWGWAVWQRSWSQFEPDGAKLLAALRAQNKLRAFDLDGAYPYSAMLRDQIAGRNSSWAVLWYAHACISGQLTLYPHLSVTENIGEDGSGTHGAGRATAAQSTTHTLRVAQAPIDVGAIPVEECRAARMAWAHGLRHSQGSRIQRARHDVRRRLRTILTSRLRSLAPR
jgi:hypothetical protein